MHDSGGPISSEPTLSNICVQSEPHDVYFPMKQSHSKILCGTKVMVKTVCQGHFSASFSKRFKHF